MPASAMQSPRGATPPGRFSCCGGNSATLPLPHAALVGSSVLCRLVQCLGETLGFRPKSILPRVEQTLGELAHRSLVLILD